MLVFRNRGRCSTLWTLKCDFCGRCSSLWILISANFVAGALLCGLEAAPILCGPSSANFVAAPPSTTITAHHHHLHHYHHPSRPQCLKHTVWGPLPDNDVLYSFRVPTCTNYSKYCEIRSFPACQNIGQFWVRHRWGDAPLQLQDAVTSAPRLVAGAQLPWSATLASRRVVVW